MCYHNNYCICLSFFFWLVKLNTRRHIEGIMIPKAIYKQEVLLLFSTLL